MKHSLFAEPATCLLPDSKHIRQVEDKSLALFPAEAGIGDGLAVDPAVYLLASVLDIAFDHQSLDHAADIGVVAAGMHNFLADADLLEVLLVGIAVIDVGYPAFF